MDHVHHKRFSNSGTTTIDFVNRVYKFIQNYKWPCVTLHQDKVAIRFDAYF